MARRALTETEVREIEELVMQQLQVLGVKQGDIIIKQDEKTRPVVIFHFPDESQQRKIIFVNENLPGISDELREELRGRLDVYYEKASCWLPGQYGEYLNSVSDWLKPEGFMVLNPYCPNEHYSDPWRVLGNRYILRNNKEVKGALIDFKSLWNYDEWPRYGLLMFVWQKVKSGAFAATKNSSSPLNKMNEGLFNFSFVPFLALGGFNTVLPEHLLLGAALAVLGVLIYGIWKKVQQHRGPPWGSKIKKAVIILLIITTFFSSAVFPVAAYA